MNNSNLPALPIKAAQHRGFSITLLGALLGTSLLVACGGGGTVPVPGVETRALDASFSTRKAVSYSPFRSANRDTETITAAMVKQDLDLLVTGGFTLLRLFDSSDNVSRLTLQVIKDNKLDIKVMLGIYLLSESNASLSAAQLANSQTFNAAEIKRGVALANEFKDIVAAVSVGNETMVSWSFVPTSVALIAGHIKAVRDQITQPVTTDDNWAFFAKASSEPNDPKAIIEAVDFVSMHTYPLADSLYGAKWDWQQSKVATSQRAVAMMDAAAAAANDDYLAVRAHMDLLGHVNKPIVVGETGWKAEPSNGEYNRASPVNQQMYFERLKAWKGPKSIFYFEAFDEPWKQSDSKWALFTVARKARCMIQGLYASSQWEAAASTCAANLAVFAPDVSTVDLATATRYTLFADATTANEVVATGTAWNGWDNPPTGYAGDAASGALTTDVSASGQSSSTEVLPVAKSWGWGVALGLSNAAADLSRFEASGSLNFSIKTRYPGKIEVGFLTGSNNSAYEVYLAIASGQYGYVNDGNWHAVSIPISEIKKAGNKASGQEASATSVFDLSRVTAPFVIADRYAKTGKASNSGDATKVYVDAIYWSR